MHIVEICNENRSLSFAEATRYHCPAPNPQNKEKPFNSTQQGVDRRQRQRCRLPPDDSCFACLFIARFWFREASAVTALTSCCRLQPQAPVRFRTDWHRSRAPAPTLWWRRPSSAPRPSGRAPCPRLLLGGPPVCLQVREVH